MKKFFFAILVSAIVFSACDKNEYKNDKIDRNLEIVGYDTVTRMLYTYWPDNNPYDTIAVPMYDDRYFEPAVRDFIYARDVLCRPYITGIKDLTTKTIIGWEDADGDDKSYERQGVWYTFIIDMDSYQFDL